MSPNEPRAVWLRRAGYLLLGCAIFYGGGIFHREWVEWILPSLRPPPPLALFKERSAEIVREYVRNTTPRKLQIGAGRSALEGWLNTDIAELPGLAFLDAAAPFPLEDRTFRYVFSEHVIEHLTLEQADVMLAESFRILEPRGRIRIATPDLRRLVALFAPEPTGPARDYLPGKLKWHDWPQRGNPAAVVLNLQLRDFGHRFVYDEADPRLLAPDGRLRRCPTLLNRRKRRPGAKRD